MTYRIGIDIGGTFTDFALFDDDLREIVTHKALTTPAEPDKAVLEGVLTLADKAHLAVADVSMVVHGTTLVTNAVIERRGTPTAMIVTRGFRDVLDTAMEQRYDLYDLRIRYPEPLVSRSLRFEVDERTTWEGVERRPLNFDSLEAQLSRAVSEHGVRAVAVCLLHSYLDDRHEQSVGAWLQNKFPALHVSLSSVVFPFAREYQRWTSTCLNAYVQPLIDEYVNRLEHGLAAAGFVGRFLIMSSSGSTLTPEMARQFPVRLLESGPAAGALMSARHSRWLDRPQVLSFDMGGTTAKGCVVQGHTPLKRYDLEVARIHEFKRGSGLPIKIPVIDMIEIGAGGGSLADIDPRGVIRVGPRSAGAMPGPACYGRGGTNPTLTDANLVLGYLDSKSFLGGRMSLDVQAARSAIEQSVAARLGITMAHAAWGIHEVINEDVAKAFRVHASERGVDYRRCSMIVFGGSGPIHGSRIARKLRLPQVICPSGAGVMSAFGLLSSPVGFELVQSLRLQLAHLTREGFVQTIAALERRVRDQLAEAGVATPQDTAELRLDMRYVGQGYEVEVAVATEDLALAFEELESSFAKAYAGVFGQSFTGKEVEIVTWKMEIRGPVPGGDEPYRLKEGPRSSGDALIGSRMAYFADVNYVEAGVYDRYRMAAGFSVAGPALVEEAESTCVLAPGDTATVDANLNLIIDVGGLES